MNEKKGIGMNSQPERILIVEDDRNMARTIRDILTDHAYEVDIAYSGDQALEMVEDNRYFCLLSDIKMPGMDGVELFHALQKTHSNLPILLMTAYVSSDLLSASVDEGVVAVLTKPLEIDLLLMYLKALK